VEEERRHALSLQPDLEERDAPAERAPAGDGFLALSSNARLDDVISSTTAAGDALHLFAEEASPAFSTPAPATALRAEPGRDRGPERDPGQAPPEPAYKRRARLREERAALVSRLARSNGQGHRAVNAWVNRSVGVRGVGDATAEQLERAIAMLERELRR